MNKFEAFKVAKQKRVQSSTPSKTNDYSFYYKLKDKFEQNKIFFNDEDFKEYFMKTKNRIKYVITFKIYKRFSDGEYLSNIGITDNIIQYLKKISYFSEINLEDCRYDFVFIEEKRDNETIEDFLKFVEGLVISCKPKEFSQDLGESFYKINYKRENSPKMLKSHTKQKSTEKRQKISSISNKSVYKFIRLSKSLNNKDNKAFSEEVYWEYNSASQDDIPSKEESEMSFNIEQKKKYDLMYASVVNNINNVIYVETDDSEKVSWESEQRSKKLNFYRKFGGCSY